MPIRSRISLRVIRFHVPSCWMSERSGAGSCSCQSSPAALRSLQGLSAVPAGAEFSVAAPPRARDGRWDVSDCRLFLVSFII